MTGLFPPITNLSTEKLNNLNLKGEKDFDVYVDGIKKSIDKAKENGNFNEDFLNTLFNLVLNINDTTNPFRRGAPVVAAMTDLKNKKTNYEHVVQAIPSLKFIISPLINLSSVYSVPYFP